MDKCCWVFFSVFSDIGYLDTIWYFFKKYKCLVKFELLLKMDMNFVIWPKCHFTLTKVCVNLSELLLIIIVSIFGYFFSRLISAQKTIWLHSPQWVTCLSDGSVRRMEQTSLAARWPCPWTSSRVRPRSGPYWRGTRARTCLESR